MRAPHKQIGSSALLAGLAIVLATLALGSGGALILVNIGWVIMVIAVGVLAAAKGQSPLWCLLGPIGMIAIAFLPDKHPERAPPAG
ncbi:MAG: hypothetical protein IPI67_35735 [Myxococcales bacterium]|nr:hypothetical protein [Myxococcales bacterium]